MSGYPDRDRLPDRMEEFSQHILENIMKRTRWSGATMTDLAVELEAVVRREIARHDKERARREKKQVKVED